MGEPIIVELPVLFADKSSSTLQKLGVDVERVLETDAALLRLDLVESINPSDTVHDGREVSVIHMISGDMYLVDIPFDDFADFYRQTTGYVFSAKY